MATLSSILAWRIPRAEEPGGLQFMGSQRVLRTEHTHSQACAHAQCYSQWFSISRLLSSSGPLPNHYSPLPPPQVLSGTFSRIDHILGHKSSLGKFKKIEIIPIIFSDHNAVRLDPNYRRKTI